MNAEQYAELALSIFQRAIERAGTRRAKLRLWWMLARLGLLAAWHRPRARNSRLVVWAARLREFWFPSNPEKF